MKLETTTKMASTVELMHLCRLCLVKEQVNVPIFEDHERDSQIFLKIVTCLPVKINKDDKLPKNICGGCSYKLDLFYQFCNSTTNAEKQLLQWFNKVGFADVDNVDNQVEAPKDIVDEAQVDSMSTETQSYILQQQQLPYGPVEFFQGDFDDSQPASVANESEIIEATVSKKRKHPTNNVSNKKSKRVVTTKTEGSDDEDDDANDTNVIPFEDSKFSLSCERDGEQAGPSGIGKADATFVDTSTYVSDSLILKTLDDIKKEQDADSMTDDDEIMVVKVERRPMRASNEPRKVMKEEVNEDNEDDYVSDGKMSDDLDCVLCKKKFKSSSELWRHSAQVHAAGLCDICGKPFASIEKLKIHRRIHTGYKPHSCLTCSKSFTRKDQLREHERVHTGEKPFICKFCGKGFSQRSPLRLHERTHTGERPYICRFCSQGFISKAVMDSHMKSCVGV